MNSQKLTQEVLYFYTSLFNKAAPLAVINEYVNAHQFCCFDTPHKINLDTIISCKLDCEAIELVTRHKKTILTKKMQLVIYLAEVNAESRPNFFNNKDSLVKGYASLIYHTIRTILLAFKGLFLLKRYRLV